MEPEINHLLETHALLGEEYRSALRFYDPEDPTSYAEVDRLVRGIDRQPQADMERLVAEIEYFANQEIAAGLSKLENKRAGVFFRALSRLESVLF